MNATLTHTCPKCAGVGTMPFRHIHDGVCFLCNGAKAVTERAASSWLAQQMGPAPRIQATGNAPAERPFKSVNLGDFGTVRVFRVVDGPGFYVRDLQVASDDGCCSYFLFFDIIRGRVVVDRELVQHGMAQHLDRAERALQAALKA